MARRALHATPRALAAVDVASIKKLREMTGAPMMECKQALGADDVDGDLTKAVDWLRKKGIAAAGKKVGRTAAHGLVGVSVIGNVGAMVEVNSETDFVARNDLFKTLVKRASDAAVGSLSPGADADAALEALRTIDLPGGDTGGAACSVADGVTELAGKVRENLVLRRGVALDAGEGGIVASYVHNTVGPDLGTIGCLVAVRTEPALTADSGAAGAVRGLAKRLAMQVVAARPSFVSVDSVPTEDLDREKAVLREAALASGKPAEIVDKMVTGRLGKFYQETVLLEQECVVGVDGKVKQLVADTGKEAGVTVDVVDFVTYRCGEGVEGTDVE